MGAHCSESFPSRTRLLLRGRRGVFPYNRHSANPRPEFCEQDDWNSPHVAVISQTLARQRWPNQDPIGQVIDFGNMDANMKPQPVKLSTFAQELGGWLADRRFLLLLVGIRGRRSGSCVSRHLRSCGPFSGAPHRGDRRSHGARREAKRRAAHDRGRRRTARGGRTGHRHCRILRHHAASVQSPFRS